MTFYGLLPDCHIPFEDKKAYELSLKVFKFLKIKELIIKGDFADFATMSMHENYIDPRLKLTFYDEIKAVRSRLKEIEKLFPKAKKTYVEGNHEHRAERKVKGRLPELLGCEFISMKHLLGLGRDWTFVPYTKGQFYKISGLGWGVRHCPLSSAVNKLKALESAPMSYSHGHDHQIYKATKTLICGTKLEVCSDGWLGDKDSPIVQYPKKTPNWALGFGLLIKEGAIVSHKTIEILVSRKEYFCYLGNKKFSVKK